MIHDIGPTATGMGEITVSQTEEKQIPDNDPTEYLPIMRHHLHENLWALNLALGYVEAQDLAQSYREGLTAPKKSSLARQLARAQETLSGYLGLNDGEENEDVSEE